MSVGSRYSSVEGGVTRIQLMKDARRTLRAGAVGMGRAHEASSHLSVGTREPSKNERAADGGQGVSRQSELPAMECAASGGCEFTCKDRPGRPRHGREGDHFQELCSAWVLVSSWFCGFRG